MNFLYKVNSNILKHDRKIKRLFNASSVSSDFLMFIMLNLILSTNFSYQRNRFENLLTFFDMTEIQKINFLNAFLLLAASVLLIIALKKNGTKYFWKSTTILSLFCVFILFWIIFFILQKFTYDQKSKQKSMLSWRLLTNRYIMNFLL